MSDELTFEQTTVPAKTVNRQPEDNPFDRMFPTEEGTAVKLTLPSKTEDDKKNVQRRIAQAQRSAKGKGLTCRKVTAEGEDGTTAVTFWTVPRITRERKAKAKK